MKQARRNAFELARHLLVSVLATLIAVGPAGLAFAGPHQTGGNGKGTVTQAAPGDKVWIITATNGAIIKYSTFDIAKDELVKFKTGDNGVVRVLNRIESKAPTKIDGAIQQDGGRFMIYIVNPAGVFFGADAKINVNGLQAAAGNLSDRDFERGVDHFTNLKGKVENAGKIGVDPSTIPETEPNDIATNQIVTNAVSLVGREVLNSGNIDANGWIVMAAGRDVFIGRDQAGNGLLLRVEGGADAVFKKSAKGVTNTGSLNVASIAMPDTKDENDKIMAHPSAVAGRISLGAGDLYGTAIFNQGAIKAREIALQASNKGDVALSGQVEASTVGISFGGDKAGKLVGAPAAPAPTLKADILNLTATGAKGQVVVADRLELQRANAPNAAETTSVNVEQKAALTTSNLAKLDIHSKNDPAKTLLNLKSDAGIRVDDRVLLTGTRLTLDAPATLIEGPRDPLVVEQLNLQSRFTQTESDLIVTGEDRFNRSEDDPNAPGQKFDVFDSAMRIAGNLQVATKPTGSGGVANGTLISAEKGTLSSIGDIITTNGGGLVIRAADVKLGTLNSDGTLTGGAIVNSGSRAARVTIKADNTAMVATTPHLLGSVQVKSIDTRAGVTVPGVDQTVGGDVIIDAHGTAPATPPPHGITSADYGDITLFGDILTTGGASLVAGDPLHDGGSVRMSADQTLTVRGIITGGGRPTGSDGNGNIELEGAKVVVAGDLNASGGTIKNDDGERNRSVLIHGPCASDPRVCVAAQSVELDADRVTISGGVVDVDGKISEGQKTDPNDPDGVKQIQRNVDLLFDTNRLKLAGGADVKSLNILARDTASPGDPDAGVLFSGNINADDFVHVRFDTADGVVRWGAFGGGATVTAPDVSVTANRAPPDDLAPGDAKVALDSDLHFNLTQPNDPNARPQFALWQAGAIDPTTVHDLLTPGRFEGSDLAKSTSTILLRTNSAMTFDDNALEEVNTLNGGKSTNLTLIADRFSLDSAPDPEPEFNVQSFELTTLGALDANFDVTAKGTAVDQGVLLHSGATGLGDLNVSGKLHSRSILLIAGNGTDPGTDEQGATGAKITIADSARFSNTDVNAAPVVFGLQQDASIATNTEGLLPTIDQFGGGSIAGMEYQLQSADGAVTLESGAADYFKDTKLLLNGQTGVGLGSEALTLDRLIAQTRGDMTASAPITVNEPNGVIDLSAGESGTGRLTIDAKLTADNIDLRAAGVGEAAGGSVASITLGDGASFAGASGIPKHFGMVQDASLAQAQLPTLADFGATTLAGMDLELRSLGGTLTLTAPDLVAKTALALEGNDALIIVGTLDLASLDAKGPLTTNGSITTVNDLSVDTTTVNQIERVVTLNGAGANSAPLTQKLVAGGALTVKGKISKTTGGDVDLESGTGKALTVGDVTTAHSGGHIDITARGDAKIGALDASGTGLAPGVTAVSVTGQGSVEIAGIDARGRNGLANAKGADGGSVVVKGTKLELGTIDASGGNGGFVTGSTPTEGGAAGKIDLGNIAGTAPIQISILGDLLAAGGLDSTSSTNPPALPPRGEGNEVHVGGALLLLAKAENGPTNEIVGRKVTIDGNVGPGVEKLTDDAAETVIPGTATGLKVVADESLEIKGDTISAGTLDLEVHEGNLDLGPKTINSDTIRLAATDGAGNNKTGTVENVDQLTFKGGNVEKANDDPAKDEQRRILSLTIEQDAGFGPGSIPDVNDPKQFGGKVLENFPAIALGLISQDGTIALNAADFSKVAGSRLTLAANRSADPNAADPIQIAGGADGKLSLQSLQLGSPTGVGGGVGGDATVVLKDLTVGNADPNAPIRDALRTFGNLTVGDLKDPTVKSNLHVLGPTFFSGDSPKGQALVVTGKLELAGANVTKTTDGDLEIKATDGIDLTAATAQSITNEGGRLVIHGPLIKGDFTSVDDNGDGNPDPEKTSPAGLHGLSLGGVSRSSNDAAVVVTGTKTLLDPTEENPHPHEYAIAVADGDLLITAAQRGGSSTSLGKYELGGDVLAFGDITLAGEGSFRGKSSYTVEAARNPGLLVGELTSGELTLGGISSADGDLKLVARGDDPSFDVPHPAAIHLKGSFRQLAGDLEVDGSLELAEDTKIGAGGDVRFDDRIQGEKGLSVSSDGQVVLFDDVALTGGTLSLSGDTGVRFASTSDTQLVQAGSISLGSGATRAPSGAATLVRDGNLSLAASGGDVAIANGQRMVVNGSLSMSAKNNISITDTAALRIKLVSQDLIVRSGSTVLANSIVSSASPRVTGGGVATFAVPTRTEVTDNIPSDEVLLRQIHSNGSPLSLASSFPDAAGPEIVEFPTIPFPAVSGPAQVDYARLTPLPPLRRPQTRPHVDVKELDASLANRPLWAEELLAYLEQRSVETPGVSEAVEHLPPVGARPGDPLEAEDRRVRGAAAERAVALYRELFRPDVARNPETGFIDEPARVAAIRDAFQQPIDALRRENGGKPVSGAALRDLIASTPGFAPAQGYGAQLGQLVAAGELALTPDQKPRFGALVLSEVTPYGIAPAEFATALR